MSSNHITIDIPSIDIETSVDKPFLKRNSTVIIDDKQQQWSEEFETLISEWGCELNDYSQMHYYSARLLKRYYYCLAVPAIIFPFIMTFASKTIVNETQLLYVNEFAFLLSGILSGLTTFFQYGQRYIQHYSYAHQYDVLNKRITTELSKKRQFRAQVDLFILELQGDINSLNENALDVVMPCCQCGKFSC